MEWKEEIGALARLHGAHTSECQNKWRKSMLRADFDGDLAALAAFVIEMIGNPHARNIASKAIGGVILLWHR